MGENDKQAVSFAGDGQSQVNSQPVSQEPAKAENEQETAPEYLTREEAQRLFEEQKNDLLKQTQSLTDKASSRLDKQLRSEIKKVNDVIDLQKKAGINITPEQERTMRQMAYDNAIGQVGEETDDSEKGAAKPLEVNDPQQVMKAATAAVIDGLVTDIYKEAGITVFENDPELEMIDKTTPMAFLNSIKAAVEKKRQRIQTAPETRIASLGKGQQTNLEAQYLEEKKKVQGDVNALIELKKNYRAKGLQV
jgi:hypothetical protein